MSSKRHFVFGGVAREAAARPELPDAAVEPAAPVVDAGSAGDRLKRFENIGPKLEPATGAQQQRGKKPKITAVRS